MDGHKVVHYLDWDHQFRGDCWCHLHGRTITMKAEDSSKTSVSKRPQCTTPQKPTLTFAVARSCHSTFIQVCDEHQFDIFMTATLPNQSTGSI